MGRLEEVEEVEAGEEDKGRQEKVPHVHVLNY